MLLGKRPPPPIMKRTTSMSGGLALDTQTGTNEEVIMSDSIPKTIINEPGPTINHVFGTKPYECQVLPLSPTPTDQHTLNQTTHNILTAHFLRTCGLCNSPLAPGRDIYMYRGDTAFCSLECRERQMKQDRRKEKWKVASNKEDHHHHHRHHRASPPPAATAKASPKSETAACT